MDTIISSISGKIFPENILTSAKNTELKSKISDNVSNNPSHLKYDGLDLNFIITPIKGIVIEAIVI